MPTPEFSERPILRRGVVGLIFRENRVLVIRRSATVVAPMKWCFPGGGIEPGETQDEALVREFREELGVEIRPIRKIWDSITPWHVHLDWWTAETAAETFSPNLAEVDSVTWMTVSELADHPDLLVSNLDFLRRLLSGEIAI